MISSVVSFSKVDIREILPGMQNAIYHIPAQKDGSILHVEDSFYYKPDIDGHQDKISVTSEQIAESLVQMHITSQLAYKSDQHPAVFCVPNVELDLKMVKEKYNKETLAALAAQRKWFIALVKIADDDWQQLRRHNMISEIQRIAARSLGLKREWLVTIDDEQSNGCPFCGSNLLNPEAPICPTCGKIHNPAKFKELETRMGATTVKEPSKTQ